jgi:hypothetical protein
MKLVIPLVFLLGCSSVETTPMPSVPCNTGDIGVCFCPGWPEGLVECVEEGVWGECVCETREYDYDPTIRDHVNEHEPRPAGPHVNKDVAARGGAGGMIGFMGGARRW